MGRKPRAGKVFLVGSGPGDPGLLTLKGRKLLARADIVLYDRRAHHALVSKLSPKVRIDRMAAGRGGERFSRKAVANQMIEPARAGKRIVLLVVGDPFLSVGAVEVVERLRRADVACEVVPGVPAVPLHGLRIVVTRARDQAAVLVRDLRARGAWVAEMPMMEFGPPVDWGPFDRAAARLGRFDWVIFTSANGVRFTLDRLLDLGRDARTFHGCRLAAIGPKTAEALKSVGLIADRVAPDFRSDCLLQFFSPRQLRGKSILLPRGDLANPMLPRELRRRGARVADVVVYRNLLPVPARRREWNSILSGGVDLVTFTSSSSVSGFVKIFGTERALACLASTRVVCIGPVTARTVEELGIRPPVVAGVHTVQGLVASILDIYSGNK